MYGMHIPARPDARIACDMTTAIDTPAERLELYRRLFAEALARRERLDGAVVLTFRADARATVEDLVRREAACCPFLDYRVETIGHDVVWTTTGDASVLDLLYALPHVDLERIGLEVIL